MKKDVLLIFIIICSLVFVSCTNNTKKEKNKNLSEVGKELGFNEYKEIKVIEDCDVFVSDSLKETYESYKESEDSNLLVGLEPIDVFKLFNSAKFDKKYDVAGSLINYPSDIDKDEFLREWKNNDVTNENEKKLLQGFLEKKSEIYQIILDDETSFIVFEGRDDFYRLEWVDPGVWKIGWLARQ